MSSLTKVASRLSLQEKLPILASAAKYDVSCASSGSSRRGAKGQLGSAARWGICHSWSADGRCVSLLKVLMTNLCQNDCAYCANRASNDVLRTAFSPKELAHLTYQLYRRNYIEGLFLSSGVWVSPDHTMELMIATAKTLRLEMGFRGYIHMKVLPGSSPSTVEEASRWCDRISVNLELPTESSLKALAPDKDFDRILGQMKTLHRLLSLPKEERGGEFAATGQSTQLIVGATPESDREILLLSRRLYERLSLRRVYYSAYVPVNHDPRLPTQAPPLLREHRLYQADWLMRFYGFALDELVDAERPNLSLDLDPKLDWALRNLHLFPVEVMSADYETLLRVPGIGPTSARRIISARRWTTLSELDLKRLGVVLRRARPFVTLGGRHPSGAKSWEDLREEFSKDEGGQLLLPLGQI